MAAEVKVLAIQVAAKVLVVQVVTEVEAEVGAEGAATTAAAPKQRKEVKRRIGGRNEIARVVGSSGIKPTNTRMRRRREEVEAAGVNGPLVQAATTWLEFPVQRCLLTFRSFSGRARTLAQHA